MTWHPLALNGAGLLADPSGALFWPDRRMLVLSDLHLEKGSAFARAGRFLPPYDTAETLSRIETLIDRIAPEAVVCLGDSFHDGAAADRVSPVDAARITGLTGGRDWIWIVGNHDPEPPARWGGRVAAEISAGPLVFRHEARPGAVGEVSGHFHPVAAVRVHGRRLRRRCFAGDGRRLVLPAFGAYAGGLNVLDPALAPVLGRRFTVHALGRDRVFELPSSRLEPDAPARPAPGRPERRQGRSYIVSSG